MSWIDVDFLNYAGHKIPTIENLGIAKVCSVRNVEPVGSVRWLVVQKAYRQ
jgi:hypothetical protein